MPRANAFMQNIYIADGFADDCDELIHRCSKVDFLRFATFSDIWKDMQLSCIYQGRTSGAEIAELSEEVLHVAKHYMVSNTDNLEESIAGLFLVYALLNLQPFPGFASLRIVQEDLPAINRIATVARRDRRHDVLYILGSVLTKNSQYHAAVRERGMEYPIRKYLEGHATAERLGVRPKGVFYRQTEELDIIRELAGLELRYDAARAALAGTSKPDRDLNYTNTNLAKEMGDSLKNLISGIVEGSDGDDEAAQKETPHSIKHKAMKSKVKPMKHLVSVDTSSKTTKPKSHENKPDIKSPPGKVKSGSPTKPLATNTQRKRKTAPQTTKPIPKRLKQPRITFESDESEDEDISLPPTDENSDSDDSTHPDDPQIEQEDTQETTQQQEIDIEIDSLPCFIRNEEGGKLFEIEIIDELKTKAAKNKDLKISELPGADVTIKKISKKTKDSVTVDVVVDQNEMAEISKVDVKTEKQKELKKNVGKKDSKSKNVGKKDSESKNVGKKDSESKNVGKKDSEIKNVGKKDSESKNVGKKDSESKNVGKKDSESKNVGKKHSESKDSVPKKIRKSVILKSKLNRLGVMDVADLKPNEKEDKNETTGHSSET